MCGVETRSGVFNLLREVQSLLSISLSTPLHVCNISEAYRREIQQVPYDESDRALSDFGT